MNLTQEIQKDILDSSTQLSVILRKAKVLSYRLKNDEFKIWVEEELNGYSGGFDELPDYRKVPTPSYGHFIGAFDRQLKNAPIPLLNFPEEIKQFASTHAFGHGIRSLEAMIDSDSNTFQLPWPPELTALIGKYVYQDMVCVSAWKIATSSQIEQILDTVRSRLLSFVLELEELNPEIGELMPGEQPPLSDEKVQQIFNTYILGGQNILSSGVTSISGEIMSDTFNLSGDFRSAILNIKSTLSHVRQSISIIPDADASIKDELSKLINQLEEELEKVPPEKDEEAQAVAESAKLLVETVNKEKPNKVMVQISAEGLKQAAKNLAVVTPVVLPIATQIVDTILKFVG